MEYRQDVANWSDGSTSDWNKSMMFGSFHSGIVNFLIGDGSVRAISVTAPAKHYTDVMCHLACVDDGNPAQLP